MRRGNYKPFAARRFGPGPSSVVQSAFGRLDRTPPFPVPPAYTPPPREARFVADLAAAPLALPAAPPDASGRSAAALTDTATRRDAADRLCLWLACDRLACRSRRRCAGETAACVFEQRHVRRPLLDAVVEVDW